jgi:hypothetical protein
MSELPQQDHAPTALNGADPTRDIRLPPLPDRPPAAMPRAWAARPQGESAAPSAAQNPDDSRPDDSRPDSARPEDSRPEDFRPDDSRPVDAARSAQPRPAVVPDEPTDVLAPPHGRPRERTLAFASPEAAPGRPMPTVGRTPRGRRRWPWVLISVLPVLVIVISGIWWYLLLRSA